MPHFPTEPGKEKLENIRRTERNNRDPGASHAPQKQYLNFRLNVAWYALSVDRLVEVLPLPKITRVPNVSDHVLGVMNFRGEVLSAIDLKQLFGLPKLTLESDATIIVVEHDKVRTGLLVDGVGELVSLSQDDLTEEPVLAEKSQPTFFEGAAHWGDILVSIIRLEGFWWLPVELQ